MPHRIEEVEEAHRIRAVVRAVPSADAAIVDLRIQAFVGVISRINRAHRFARSFFAVLAEHRHELYLHVGIFALDVALDSNPIDRPALRGFLGSDGWDVVLDSASDDASFASGAPIEIDHHRPLRLV